MYESLRKNWDKTKYLLISGSIVAFLLLLTGVYKNDQKISEKTAGGIETFEIADLKTFKDYIFSQIKSPFINVNYEIKKGDTIQKILKKYSVKNNEIQTVISQFKKYGNPNQLMVGNKIDFIIEKNPSKNKNSILKFFVPITKSTAIEIGKNSENQIVSKKIIDFISERI